MTDASDLYRFYDAEGRLLYIGRSAHAVTRIEAHKGDKDWWAEVVRMEIEKVPTEQIVRAELEAIASERPAYNVAGVDVQLNTYRPKTPQQASEHSRAYRDRKRGGPPRSPAPCGTRAAAARHRRRGEPLDAACVDAERAYQREVARRRRKGT